MNRNFMVGQCYDVLLLRLDMTMEFKNILRINTPLRYIGIHCASHRLNLCILKACRLKKIQAANNERVSVFFSNSAKRLSLIQAQIENKCPKSSHLRLKKHCSTRWVENREAVFIFKELLYIQQ